MEGLKTPSQSLYRTALGMLTDDPDGDMERLFYEIVRFEEEKDESDDMAGFEWHQVHGDARTLNKLVANGLLDIVFKSNKYTVYRTTNREALIQAIRDFQAMLEPPEEEVSIPDDLFDIIVGHEDKKDIIMRSIEAEEPVHLLLHGVPASAKTLFLEELQRLPNSHFSLGSSLSKAGIYEVCFNERPRYLILDELDKVDDQSNLSALLSLMESGVVKETKYRRHRRIELTSWVFASANRINHLPLELRSRFQPLKFEEYSQAEFIDVVVSVLTRREQLPEWLALYIAGECLETLVSNDVRDTIKITRLLKEHNREEVDHVVKIIREQL